MINDAFLFTTVKTMGISHLLVCLRRAFVKRGDLEPMPENSGEFAVNEDFKTSYTFYHGEFLLI
jgi:hypothetical protein